MGESLRGVVVVVCNAEVWGPPVRPICAEGAALRGLQHKPLVPSPSTLLCRVHAGRCWRAACKSSAQGGLLCLAPPRARPTRAMALNGSCARTLDKHVPPCTITPPRHAMHSQAAAHKPMPSSFEVQTSHTLCCAGKVQGINPTHKPMPSNFEVQTLAHPLLRRRHAGHRPRDAAREGHVRAH